MDDESGRVVRPVPWLVLIELVRNERGDGRYVIKQRVEDANGEVERVQRFQYVLWLCNRLYASRSKSNWFPHPPR
jgi:hypothetical protein